MDWLVAIFGVWTQAGYQKPGTAFPVEATIAAELRGDGSARDAEPDEIPAENGAGDATAPGAGSPPNLAELPPFHELRLAAIAAAVPLLAAGDFTAGGTARIAPLRAKLGFEPTAREAIRAGKRKVA